MRLSRVKSAVCFAVGFAAATAFAERTITADAYFDKLRGMWLGQLIGVFTGLPTEGHFAWEPNPAGFVPWVLLQEWSTDDDTDIEYLIQHVYALHGFEPTPDQLREEWRLHIPFGTVWIANVQARYLMEYGFRPPETGSYQRNVNWWAIDPQLTTDAIGAISPGRRQWTIDHVGAWARITTDGSPVHAAQFYAAMFAASVFESDVPTLVQLGLDGIPRSSRAAAAIRDVVAWFEEDMRDGVPDWRATRRRIRDSYWGDGSFGRNNDVWVDSTVNVASTTLALLYGGGRFEDTVQIALLSGWDNDCNAATSGGLIGMILGLSGLPPNLVAQCGDVYRNTRRPGLPAHGGPFPYLDSNVEICRRWQALAEQVIVLDGGTITGSGSQRGYHVLDADPVTPEPERWDPPQAAGLVGALRGLGRTVTVSASLERRNLRLDRENLDAIADGITDPRYNGHRPYWTRDGVPGQPPGGDFYQLNFPQMVRVDRVVFYAGDVYPARWNDDPRQASRDGGFFLNLTVEVLRGNQWFAAANVVQSEPLDPFKYYQVIRFDMSPEWCLAVRIRGDAGGAEPYTTILELEAYGYAPPHPAGDLNCDGTLDAFDIEPFTLALFDPPGYAQRYPGCDRMLADVNGDGLVDAFDIEPFIDLLFGP